MTRIISETDASRIRTLYQYGVTLADLHRMNPSVTRQRIEQIAKSQPKEPKPPRVKPPKPPTLHEQRWAVRRQEIMDYVSRHPRCRQSAIGQALGLPIANVFYAIERLREEGAVAFAPGTKDLITPDQSVEVAPQDLHTPEQRRRAILDYVRQFPRCRQNSIALAVNLTGNVVHSYITQLREEGLIAFAEGTKDLILSHAAERSATR